MLCSAREAIPQEREKRLMVMRPDGTKNELFYQSDDLLIAEGRAFENSRGLIFFSEKSEEEAQGKLVSVRYNHPMGSRDEAISDRAGDFISASRGLNGQVMISFREEKQGTYDLYTFEPGPEASLMPLYADPESNTLGAVLLEPRERPKKLPSAVNTDNDTALLLCQDANFTGTGDFGTEKKAVKMQLLGVEGYLGEADLEQDGSVYLKVSADTPFRLQTLDEDGKLVQGPSSWINLRPNERRGCVGCHAGHERVPANVQPLAVQKAPVEILNHHKSIIADAIKK